MNCIKPHLTEINKYGRICFAVDRMGYKNSRLMYDNFYNSIHVEEWFFLTEENMRFYSTKAEVEAEKTPKRLCTHKSHILKIMAWPRFENGECVFDEKIGIWPFVEHVAAKRSSSKHTKGTIETKPVNVKKDNYLQMIIEKVLPAIHERWPSMAAPEQLLTTTRTRQDKRRSIHIQHDNAPVHFTESNPEWKVASKLDNWCIELKNQCPNSPDTNICDLGFFRTLQLEQWKLPCAKSTDELIKRVEQAFNKLSPESIDANFVTLQSCLDEIVKHHHCNDYKIPHLGKAKIHAIIGKLPDALPVSDVAKAVLEEFDLYP
jgi:hypothetical protein